MASIGTAFLVALLALWLAILAAARRTTRPRALLRSAIGGLLGLNGLALVATVVLMFLSLSQPIPVLAQETVTSGSSGNAIAAALATGLACIGAGIGVGISGAAAIGTITERPEALGRTLIFVGLAEGTAIYGLIISFMVLGR